MYSKEKLLEMLSNKKASVRYEACEWIRVSQESSSDIVFALKKATHDPDIEVAERAIHALQADIHHQMAIKIGIVEPDQIQQDIQTNLPVQKESGLHEFMNAVTLVLGLITIFLFAYDDTREFAFVTLFSMVFSYLFQHAARERKL